MRDEGDVRKVPGGQQRALLAILALQPGVVVSAERLVDELWGDATPQQPANALHVVVSKLRRAIGSATIESQPPGYCLALPPEAIDVGRFERLVGEAGDCVASGDPSRALQRLDEALSLWRGAALDEFAELRIASEAARRLDEVRATAVEQRLAALLALGRSGDVVHDVVGAIARWPYRERLRAHLMLALYRSGRQADALRAFTDARAALADDLGLDPGPELRDLEARILAHDSSLDGGVAGEAPIDVHPTERPPVSTGNLRASVTSFVGRDADIVALAGLFDVHRLVTLVGPGGCGKTRLAIEFARSNLESLDGGAWLVGLDSISSGREVDGAVAAALGLTDADLAGQSATARLGLRERIIATLAGRRTLIVLDNCEHVIDDAAALAIDLVERLSDLRVLATSREALRIAGEAVWPVPPLDVRSAAKLFSDRARAASPTFDPTPVTEGVEQLCADLDGMPLAIELIAARSNAFTVEQMQERLADRFQSISAGTRGRLQRHQTLRAVTDWSHDLLFEAERALFRRLSVFTGGWTLEAAEAICSGDPIEAVDVADTLARLVDKSLVIADAGRYRMLITLVEYGRARLDEAGEFDEMSLRAARWFGDLALRSFSDWRVPGGRDQAWWMRHINADLDNVRRALDWSVSHENADAAGRLAAGLGWFWWHTGRASEGVASLNRVLGFSDLAEQGTRGLALTWLARLSMDTGDLDGASASARQAIVALGDDDDPALESLAEFVLFRVNVARGNGNKAAEHARRSTSAQERGTTPWSQGITAVLRAAEATLAGDPGTAERELVTATSLLRTVGDVAALVLSLHGLLRLQLARQALDAADATARDAITMAEQFGLRGWVAVLSNELGSISSARGDSSATEQHHTRALHLARELGLPAVETAAIAGLNARVDGDE